MQENLDVLLSFVVVIIGLSILLQIIVEAIKNCLKLRWSVYEKFFMDIYREYFSDNKFAIENQDIRQPDSSSVLARTTGFIKKTGERMKIGSVGYRFEDFYKTVVSFATEIENLKKILLETKMSLAMKEEKEINAYLMALPEKLSSTPAKLKSIDISKLFKIYNRMYNVLGDFSRVKKFHSALDKIATVISQVQQINLRKRAVTAIDEILSDISEIEHLVIDYRTKIENNADNWLQSLENKYTRTIAAWTFWLGLALVMFINADSRLIYTTLKSEPAIRAGIIEQSKTLTESISLPERGKEINDLNVNVNVLKKDLAKSKKLDAGKYNAFWGQFKSLAKAIADDAASFRESKKIALPYNLIEGQDKKNELLKLLEGYKDKTNKALTREEVYEIGNTLDSAVLRIVKNFTSFTDSAISSQKELLYSTGLPLGWDYQQFTALFENKLHVDIWNIFKKILGLLTTAVLISFGAPFWNEVLKSLFGLKAFLRKFELPGKS